jgi:hypothetical protein
VLVYEQDGDVLALGGEAIEGSLDGAVVGFGVDDKEVLLRVWGLRNMLDIRQRSIAWLIAGGVQSLHRCPQAACLSPSPGAVS